MRTALKWSIIALVGTLVILAAILLPLYIVERDVTFEVISTDTKGFSRTFDGFSGKITAHVEADNRNFFDVTLTSVSVQAISAGYVGPLGVGEVHDVVLDDRTTTSFDLNMTLTYNIDSDPNGTLLNTVMESCSQGEGMITLDVQIHVEYKVWAKSGQRDETRVISQACPNLSL